MRILTDLYRFERKAQKAKTRLDCTASTHSYPLFEDNAATTARKGTEKSDAINIGDIIVYYNDTPGHFKCKEVRRTDKCLSIKSKNCSSVFVPDITKNIGYGDAKDTADAIIFVFSDWEIINGVIQPGGNLDVFIARGQSNNVHALYQLALNGELNEEMNELRKRASPIKRE
ncbi:MAG: hypothetical protein MSS52_09050 [Prevotella sp.]|nr:hypothetical protein [Prevotella sp.]